jgi:hypothetical protein
MLIAWFVFGLSCYSKDIAEINGGAYEIRTSYPNKSYWDGLQTLKEAGAQFAGSRYFDWVLLFAAVCIFTQSEKVD